MKKKQAFTLAEVLITLAIIGIVAAITIPSVIANYQQQEFKTGLRKAVSVLNEAIQVNIVQEGETPYENQDLFIYLQRHMPILKSINSVTTCRDTETGGYYDFDQKGLNFCHSDGSGSTRFANSVFYTTDGMRFEFPLFSSSHKTKLYLHESGINTNIDKKGPFCQPNGEKIECYEIDYGDNRFCGSYGLNNNSHGTKNTPCAIMVDVNGDRKPNTLAASANGHVRGDLNAKGIYSFPSISDKRLSDIFTILITEDRAIPFGVVAQRAMYEK